MEDTPEDIVEMINDCFDRESKLTHWEGQFLDEIVALMSINGHLSMKQAEKLEEIWNRVTGEGGSYV